MCDFNNLDSQTKLHYKTMLHDTALALGGVNFFLQFLETVRHTKPHVLLASNCKLHTPWAYVTWSKVIFKDKLDLFLKARLLESKNGNFLPSSDDKNYKNVLNLVRTLSPIHFEFHPKNVEEIHPFSVQPFDLIDAQTTRINPHFDALFFCSIETIKKILNYEPKP